MKIFMWKKSVLLSAAGLSAAVVALTAGCAANKSKVDASVPGSRLGEYRQIYTEAEATMRMTLRTLDQVSAESNVCSAAVLSELAAAVNRLQVESLQVRAHTEAMLARGDAYFATWHENMALVKDPKRRAIAEARRPQLEESFNRIKSIAKEGRAAFEPFLHELRQLRNALEMDPASLSSSSSQDLVKQARNNGIQVVQALQGVVGELDKMRTMLSPATSASQREL